MGRRISKVAQCIRLATLLQSGIGFSVPELVEDLQVSRRTVHRYLRLLREAGLPVQYVKDKGLTIQGNFTITLCPLNDEEAVSLFLAAHVSSLLCGRELGRLTRLAISKLLTHTRRSLREQVTRMLQTVHLDDSSASGAEVDEVVSAEILRAVHQQQPIRIVYGNGAHPPIRTKVMPHNLLVSSEKWQLVGRSSWHRKVLRFDMQHIRCVEPVREPEPIKKPRPRRKPPRKEAAARRNGYHGSGQSNGDLHAARDSGQ
jgi:predicted DNA-binding transcriptional regulator YafY